MRFSHRKKIKIADDLGTGRERAVHGVRNKGTPRPRAWRSPRNPANGEKEFTRLLANARARTWWPASAHQPHADLSTLEGLPEEAGRELGRGVRHPENHFRDMCGHRVHHRAGKLWMLQTRVGKRTAAAAARISPSKWREGGPHLRGARRPSCGMTPSSSDSAAAHP